MLQSASRCRRTMKSSSHRRINRSSGFFVQQNFSYIQR
uniref:Uncharacterized protein n=1 Tax=Arundo donax TaxID=35708 RepID=A0A0A9FXU5_ARUDO